jgi:hypothetical protein
MVERSSGLGSIEQSLLWMIYCEKIPRVKFDPEMELLQSR